MEGLKATMARSEERTFPDCRFRGVERIRKEAELGDCRTQDLPRKQMMVAAGVPLASETHSCSQWAQ